MALGNTTTSYGSVTKTFHWLTALGIFLALPLGYFANELAHAIETPEIATTDAQVARAALLFSLHKTIGLTVFFVALARILWALTQTKPGLLNGDTVLESRLAEVVHWLLYGSLVAVPLSGWVHHASTTGFAPIWWPFGQSLPFVPKDEGVAQITATLHFLLQRVLVGALALHIAGALKHHVIDQDATLRRMLPGYTPAQPTDKQPGHGVPFLGALAVWAVVLIGANTLGWFKVEATENAPAQSLAEVESDWTVQDGVLEITVVQMGSEVTGSFADWTADISYEAEAENPKGEVTVTVSIPSLTLGSVTDQAMGTEYFNTEAHPTATFNAEIIKAEGLTAQGTLTIKDQSVPVDMPFDLTIEGDTATATGGLTVDRRSFNIGGEATDSLAASVDIRFELTATRD
jgi:cytochrome b561/polyisoprenoid-binding protein YceI